MSPIGKIRRVDRGSVRRSVSREVEIRPLLETSSIPLLVQSPVPGGDLLQWLGDHRSRLEEGLRDHGAVLFRDFHIVDLDHFQRVVEAASGDLLEYTYRSTPRKTVSGNIYTSTEYPASEEIPMHNENSYTRSWPMKVFFYCEKEAAVGGMTPLADSHRVHERIPAEIRDRFTEHGVMYVRNYGAGADLPWSEVFQTEDRSEVEEFCRAAGIDFEWKSGDGLRTRQVCQAVATHPIAGQPLWFNQAHLFHVTSLPGDVREAMLEVFDEEDLPRNTYYGDGSPIPHDVLETIREIYQEEKVMFPWAEGDVLAVDNMAVAHGRTSFEGDRKVRVGMSEPVAADDLGL